MENLELLYSLFNQHVFQDAKNNIESLEYYFNTNPSTSGNPLIKSLLDAIRNYSYEAIDYPLFQSILQREGMHPSEQKMILDEVGRWRRFSSDQMAPTKSYLRDICADMIIRKANNKFSGNPYEMYRYLKNSEIRLDNTDLLSSYSFDSFDISKLVDEVNQEGYSSSFMWINDLFEPAHKYEVGQMVLISCPPGTGKTLWMMTEALNMALTSNAKIHYLAMGDMKPRDFIIRMGAIYTGRTFGDVARNLGPIYETLKNLIGNRLEISVIPAGQITSEDYVEYVRGRDFNVVFIDYDSNFKLMESESMYNDYGIVYNNLTKLTQDGRLVFVAAQPKVFTWTNPVIELGDVGESARKIHTVDILFTAGKFISTPNHVGIFKCCKNRRGEEGGMIGYIRLNNGRFKFIPIEVAKQLAEESVKKFYSESDIDSLVRQFENNKTKYNLIEDTIVGGAKPASKFDNPFKNR